MNKQFSNISTWLSYSFSKNNYTFDALNSGNSFPNNVDVRHALTFAGTYTYNKLKVALGLNWHSGKPITIPISGSEIQNNSVNFGPTNSENLKDYFRVDISALYDFKLGKNTNAKAGISIWNLFDRENEVNRFFRNDQDILRINNQTSLGFTPNAVFRVFFD